MHKFKWYRVTCWSGMEERVFEKDRKSCGTVPKVWQKKSCGRAAFLETLQTAIISLRKKIIFSRKVLQTYSGICIFCLMQCFADIFRNMHFLCDAIDLKQSVEGTLKTVLDEVHFIVNLYSFLPLVPQVTSSFPKVSHSPPPRQNNFQNSPSRRINNSLSVYVFLEFEL